jgi:hypothetical protein
MTSVKGLTGHSLGAARAIEPVAVALGFGGHKATLLLAPPS